MLEVVFLRVDFLFDTSVNTTKKPEMSTFHFLLYFWTAVFFVAAQLSPKSPETYLPVAVS